MLGPCTWDAEMVGETINSPLRKLGSPREEEGQSHKEVSWKCMPCVGALKKGFVLAGGERMSHYFICFKSS